MPKTLRHAPGTFCWPELYSTDPGRARDYYTALFGWTVKEIPMGPGAVYTIFTAEGAEAAACYGRPAGEGAPAMPSYWASYVSVESADGAAARATARGGAVDKAPFDVPGVGRMAALRDPAGAAFCVWEAKPHAGIGILDEPNTLVWTELLTRDTEACARFYAGLFDWEHKLWPMAGGASYHLFLRGEAPAGGMLAITPEMGPVRDCWCVYFRVEDCDGAVARSRELGGTISVPAQDVPAVGRFAVLIDPAGAHFGIMQRAAG